MARSQWIVALTRGIRERSTDFRFDGFASQRLPFPPIEEQIGIVRFLSHTDHHIAHYIRSKQQLITLLEEEKQAIVRHAVTRGLDRSVRLKSSGVEWLGNVPDHWKVVRLGRLIQLTTGFPFKSEDFSQDQDDIRLLRGINVSPDKIRWDSVVRWPSASSDGFSAYALMPGDVVLGMDRPIIAGGVRVARVQSKDVPSLLLQRVARIRPYAELDSEFMLLLLRSNSFSDYMAPIFTGISVPHLSPEQIESFRIALPRLEEQNSIVTWVKEATGTLVSAITTAHQEIALLREYRTRLTVDAVTGKVDVREPAANLQDEPVAPVAPDLAEVLEGEDAEDETTELAEAEVGA
jgi:type I restriction enzyme, S subunit